MPSMKRIFTFLTVSLALGLAPNAGAITPDTPPRDSKVIDVFCGSGKVTTNFAQRGKTISIVVTNLENWLNWSAASKNLPNGTEAKREKLVPVINHIPMVGSTFLRPMYSSNKVERLLFKLDRDAADPVSRDSWKQLFNSVGLFGKQRVSVSVGFPDSRPMRTEVRSQGKGDPFYFVTVPINGFSVFGFVFIAIVLFFFVRSAAKTGIIREHFAPLRPDGNATFSLARTQMAFWFFLVLASYFLLWTMTGDKDTIPGSLLVLMGISAGTALGSALVDVGRSSAEGRGRYFRKPESGQSESQLVAELMATKQNQEQRLRNTLKILESLPGTSLVEIENQKKEQQKIAEEIHQTDVQLEFYKSNPVQRFMSDILSDDGTTSFHRYQMAAWTLVLGIVFLKDVVTEIAMPEFNSTLLALMGISGGTYIGFKIPTAKS